MENAEVLRRLMMNAIDFLRQAESEFNHRPKHSVINFYAAVELILKARLFAEHWTLIVSKPTTRNKFADGDFNSVSFEDAVVRLRDIVGATISENARHSFDTLRRHRNKMVHFFHNADQGEMEKIAAEQLRAWYYLNQLVTVTWHDVFAPYTVEIEVLEKSLTAQREYLRARFDDLKPRLAKIHAAGVDIVNCRACNFEAAEVDEIIDSLFRSSCRVCSARRRWLEVACQCGKRDEFEGDTDSFTCRHCGISETIDSLVDRLNEEFSKPDEAILAVTPANCGECEGYHTVIDRAGLYVCLQCLDVSKGLDHCAWCGEHSSGDLSDSYLIGCSHCEGHAGWNKDD